MKGEQVMKARVDQDMCIGSAVCVSTAPDVFELDVEGLSTVAGSTEGKDEVLRQAAENCPVQAIILEDDEGNQVYP
jgi:ferredoxin